MRAILVAVVLGVSALPAKLARSQAPPPGGTAADTVATVKVRVLHGPDPVEGVVVRAGRVGATTDSSGRTELRLDPGLHVIVGSRPGFRSDSVRLALGAGADTSVTLHLTEVEAELAAVVVSATRGGRRVEDTPLRVEVIDEEELAEKASMTPGDIAMMLNETSGLRVQATNPSLGSANVRVQGLLGRYTLVLADGLPLHGGQTGGLGLLQIPLLDLGRVEVVKGTASALYGSSALGGVVNLVSRQPGERAERTALVNQTTRGGSDAVFFGAGPASERWGYTLLSGFHRQRSNDLDGDGWTDMSGYQRAVVRPRLHFDDGAGRTAFVTAGFTAERREGGTMEGRTLPTGEPYLESLRTRRADVGALARWVIPDSGRRGAIDALRGSILTVRGSAVELGHRHRYGRVGENDRHRTWFGEAALAVPRVHDGRTVTYIVGAALQSDVYRAADVAGFDYAYTTPAAFAQLELDPKPWLSLSTSARVDAHSEFGTLFNPRVSILLRRAGERAFAGWTLRLSGGTGAFAPTPFTEQTETTGLTPLLPLTGLVAERARSGSIDVGGPVETSFASLELNGTLFGSRIADPIQLFDAEGVTPTGAGRLALANGSGPTRTRGAELLLRATHKPGNADDAAVARLTASYTYLHATECDPRAAAGGGAGVPCARREVPLTPRHAASVVASVEREGRSRVGMELYYTGRQPLDDNPFRAASQPYLVVGVLGERSFATPAGVVRAFVNLENLTDVRQTRVDPLLRPTRGPGGRWTTDVWSLLEGRTVNAGARLAF